MDIDIFKNGWNEKNAYAFGWVMSDGCLLKEGRNKTSYGVRIASNDLDIISNLHEYMCIGNKIYRQSERNYMIKFRNQESIAFMIDNNLTERKSLTMEMPQIPSEYMRDFIRGYFDGDGSIVLKKTRYNTYGQASFTSGSENFLIGLQDILGNEGIESHLYKDGRTNNRSLYLRVIKRSDLEKLFYYLYDGASETFRLRRKYDKYLGLMMCKPKYNIA